MNERPYQRKRQPHPPTPPQELDDTAVPSTLHPSTTRLPRRQLLEDKRSSTKTTKPNPSPSTRILSNGLHVLHTASLALVNLSQFYAASSTVQDSFTRAVQAIVSCAGNGGKLVICGMGKSGRIGEKLAATFNSMGLVAVFLHPAEAVHGDLGMVRKVGLALARSIKYVT